jgi:uncharacterized protein (DUF2126 family)
VKLSGFTADSRYAVACNGRKVPLQPTGTAGEMVAGVRYRARRLSESLHPTIPVHAPLVFDLIDRWTNCSVARCIYHATPPDGSMYPSRPADAAEAERRRTERFEIMPPPDGAVSPLPDEINPSFPMTLDLRFPDLRFSALSALGTVAKSERPGPIP